MFGHAARAAARPAMAAATAVAAANAAHGTAQARAPPAQGGTRQAAAAAPHVRVVDRDMDSWLLTEVQDEVVLFQPYSAREVDEAAAQVMALMQGSNRTSPPLTPIITEPADDGYEAEDALAYAARLPRASASSSASASSTASGADSGALADAVIEAAGAGGPSRGHAHALQQGQQYQGQQGQGPAGEGAAMHDLMAITTRMLRRPGMQREVVLCMLEDVEVRELMLRQCSNLDSYLLAAGIHTPALLTSAPEYDAYDTTTAADADAIARSAAAAPPSRPLAAGAEAEAEGEARGGPGGLVGRLVGSVAGAVAGALEAAGDALASLGGWLRRHVAGAFAHGEEEQEAEQEGGEEEQQAQQQPRRGGAARGPQRTTDQVIAGAMALAVAVFCVLVIRRPVLLRPMAAAGAAAAAGAGVTAAAKRRQ